jgi:hypothetical protein
MPQASLILVAAVANTGQPVTLTVQRAVHASRGSTETRVSTVATDARSTPGNVWRTVTQVRDRKDYVK